MFIGNDPIFVFVDFNQRYDMVPKREDTQKR